jgi:hypothetical protein
VLDGRSSATGEEVVALRALGERSNLADERCGQRRQRAHGTLQALSPRWTVRGAPSSFRDGTQGRYRPGTLLAESFPDPALNTLEVVALRPGARAPRARRGVCLQSRASSASTAPLLGRGVVPATPCAPWQRAPLGLAVRPHRLRHGSITVALRVAPATGHAQGSVRVVLGYSGHSGPRSAQSPNSILAPLSGGDVQYTKP